MRIFVAGGAGAVGRQLVPMLVAAGHQVTGTTRSAERQEWLRRVGAEPAVVDVFDADALRIAVVDARPDVVVHQLTDLTGGFEPHDLARNRRLRELGTRHLVDATLASAARRMVAQSGAWLYAPGRLPHLETDPLRQAMDDPADVVSGIIELERLVLATEGLVGLVLRYGFLYGPGTAQGAPGEGPTVEVAAAARAAALAAERGLAGIYNVVDDGGEVSNRRARAELGWSPDASDPA